MLPSGDIATLFPVLLPPAPAMVAVTESADAGEAKATDRMPAAATAAIAYRRSVRVPEISLDEVLRAI